MGKIAIVYWSGTGNTQAMAELVAEGARAAGASPELFTAAQFSAEKVKEYTALALGCPSMGAEQLEETEFEPLYQSLKPVLGGKALTAGATGNGCAAGRRTWKAEAPPCWPNR